MERVGRSGNHVGPAPSSSSSCRRGGASTTHAKLILKTGSNSVAQRIDLKDQAIELKRERGDVAAPPPWILRALRDAHLDCAQHQVHYYREIEPVPDRCLYASIHSPASVGRTTAGERTRGGIPGGVTHRMFIRKVALTFSLTWRLALTRGKATGTPTGILLKVVADAYS